MREIGILIICKTEKSIFLLLLFEQRLLSYHSRHHLNILSTHLKDPCGGKSVTEF